MPTSVFREPVEAKSRSGEGKGAKALLGGASSLIFAASRLASTTGSET
jgi:hypothetical protein